MIKVGLIGYGYWGKILHKTLNRFCDVKFICKSKDNYKNKLKEVDWVFVVTPDETHYEIVKNCLNSCKNVFCEKPLTLTYEQSKKLYDLAEKRNVRLYVDDIENYKKHKFEIKDNNFIERRKSGGGDIKDILYRLAYHDIYILYECIKDSEFKYISSVTDKENYLKFTVEFDNKNFEFNYDLNSSKTEHKINGYNMKNETDVIPQMLLSAFNKSLDCGYNKKITLFTNKIIDKLNKQMFPKIAVVGGGIFGCTTSCRLAKEGYDVTLYEKNNDIITQASNINQYRLHRGYHYPRSKETAQQSQWGEKGFLQEYADAVVNGNVNHYYCIAKEDSKVNAKQYWTFLNEMNLYYKQKKVNFVRESSVDLTVEVKELLFNPEKLKKICWNNLNTHNVKVELETEFSDFDKYDYIINATYANLNKLLPKDKQKDYQFELCEKPVVKLPEQYKNKSVVIMDGPFMCIDPLGDTGLHVMGNVVHAIHSTNVGKFPEYDEKFDELLNKGIVENPSITNIDKFIESAKKFFVDIDKAEHIGSMFTFRTVLPNKEEDDARPTLVENPTDNIFNLFSGKIGTCVSATEELMEYV